MSTSSISSYGKESVSRFEERPLTKRIFLSSSPILATLLLNMKMESASLLTGILILSLRESVLALIEDVRSILLVPWR